MKCPNCNAPMKDEQIFCEKCGKERQLVPVFEAEIDETIKNAISGIAVDLADTQEINPEELKEALSMKNRTVTELTEKENKRETGIFQKGKKERKASASLVVVISGILVVLLLVVSSVVLYHLNNASSYDFQVKKAEEMSLREDYEQMLKHAKKAMEIAPNSSDAKMLMARAYIGLDNDRYARETLEDLLAFDNAYTLAYDLLIPIYEETDSYDRIADLLKLCSEQSILDKYVDYLAGAPQTSEESGQYENEISLKLIAPGKGDIYYTLNGTEPDAYSEKYMAPILLESGKYTVKAIYKNTFGVISEVMTAEYSIEKKMLDAPVIDLEPGTYVEPQYVSLSVPANKYQIYYTTDGSVPGLESRLYEEPIPLPLGESFFAFVMYDENGMPGKVAYAEYYLDMQPAISKEQAQNLLMQKLVLTGYITDVMGHVADMDGTKQYEEFALISEGGKHYYLFYERFQASDGTVQRTGNRFVVNVDTGEVFFATKIGVGRYDLQPM